MARSADDSGRTLGVVGAGLMGAGIASEAVRHGIGVTLVDVDEAALARVRNRLPRSADPQLLATSTSLEALAACDDVIEAVPEDRELKTSVLGTVAGLLGDDAMIASNTSSIPIADLAEASGRPTNVVGMHFFSPVSTMKLVELIVTPQTVPAVAERARALAAALGKQVVSAPDETGFIVNKLLVPYLLSAIRLLENGKTTAEDIDSAMELGCGHPMGPLRLADFIGLDVVEAIARELYAATGDPADKPPELLADLVAGGRLGRKSSSGFYDY